MENVLRDFGPLATDAEMQKRLGERLGEEVAKITAKLAQDYAGLVGPGHRFVAFRLELFTKTPHPRRAAENGSVLINGTL
jgi:hypothetical protein